MGMLHRRRLKQQQRAIDLAQLLVSKSELIQKELSNDDVLKQHLVNGQKKSANRVD